MSSTPFVCYLDAKHELVSEKGKIKHAALTLYGYYCMRRNDETELCFPSLETTAQDLGMPVSNVSMLTDFLEDKFWLEKAFIGKKRNYRLLKGFYSPENPTAQNGQKILKNRNKNLKNRNEISNKQNSPLKEERNNESNKLTKRGATEVAAPDGSRNSSPAGKPTNAAPTRKSALRSSANKKPADPRINHPAVRMVKEIAGRYAPKEIWDQLIREVGNKPDVEFFSRCYERWRSFSGNAVNYDQWILLPNQTKKLPERFERGGNGNGNKKPIDVVKKDDAAFDDYSIELDERDLLLPGMREVVLESLKVMQSAGSVWISELENTYHPDDWKWLMKNLSVEQEG